VSAGQPPSLIGRSGAPNEGSGAAVSGLAGARRSQQSLNRSLWRRQSGPIQSSLGFFRTLLGTDRTLAVPVSFDIIADA